MPPNNGKFLLPDATAIHLRFVHPVVSSQVIAGEKISLEVVEPVLVGDLVVIAQHATAEATVTLAQANRSMGRGGNLQMKIENVQLADGELVPLRAVKDVKGAGKEPVALMGIAGGAGFAYAPLSPLLFLFYVRGKNASIPAGAEIIAYVTGDFPLDPANFHPATPNPTEKSETK